MGEYLFIGHAMHMVPLGLYWPAAQELHCMLPLLVSMGCCPGEQVLEPLTQSFIEVAPECIVVLPDAQSVHTTDPVPFAYVFIRHSMHMAPLGLYWPAGQTMQLLGSEVVGEGILPAGQVGLLQS